MNMWRAVLAAAGMGLLCGCTSGPGPTGHAAAIPYLTRTIQLPGVGIPPGNLAPNAIPGRLDHLAYDPATDRLYLAALEQGSLEVIDLKTGDRIKRITGLPRPQGIAVVRVPGSATIVVGCGGDGTVRAFDAQTLVPGAVTPVGTNADNVRFDGLRTIYVGCGGETGAGLLAVLDASSLAKVGEIALPLRPESFQLATTPQDPAILANFPGGKTADNDGFVAAVDPRRVNVPVESSVIATWPLQNAARNFPLSVGVNNNNLAFLACRKPGKVIALNTITGQIASEAACVPDSDDLFVDPKRPRLYVIGGGRRAADPATANAPTPGADAALDVFAIGSAGELTRVGSVATLPHARTGLLVSARRAIYVAVPPTAKHDAQVLEFALD